MAQSEFKVSSHDETRVKKRAAKYRSLSKIRISLILLGVAYLVLFTFVLNPRTTDRSLINREQILFLMALTAWLIPHVEMVWIRYLISKECPACHSTAIRLTSSQETIHAVRSVEKIVANKMTGANESRQVSVTDHEVTEGFICRQCSHNWKRRSIHKGW